MLIKYLVTANISAVIAFGSILKDPSPSVLWTLKFPRKVLKTNPHWVSDRQCIRIHRIMEGDLMPDLIWSCEVNDKHKLHTDDQVKCALISRNEYAVYRMRMSWRKWWTASWLELNGQMFVKEIKKEGVRGCREIGRGKDWGIGFEGTWPRNLYIHTS